MKEALAQWISGGWATGVVIGGDVDALNAKVKVAKVWAEGEKSFKGPLALDTDMHPIADLMVVPEQSKDAGADASIVKEDHRHRPA
ncbi:hypothetical protein JB92DRAFT_3125148 [Gautieria morchelliformis]|nr:hypothetical protein JB92DRAFT_3125148 [Gautieria morchelliformis]